MNNSIKLDNAGHSNKYMYIYLIKELLYSLTEDVGMRMVGVLISFTISIKRSGIHRLSNISINRSGIHKLSTISINRSGSTDYLTYQ